MPLFLPIAIPSRITKYNTLTGLDVKRWKWERHSNVHSPRFHQIIIGVHSIYSHPPKIPLHCQRSREDFRRWMPTPSSLIHPNYQTSTHRIFPAYTLPILHAPHIRRLMIDTRENKSVFHLHLPIAHNMQTPNLALRRQSVRSSIGALGAPQPEATRPGGVQYAPMAS
jgi:hypothetical protein